jgi:hypothetical protein
MIRYAGLVFLVVLTHILFHQKSYPLLWGYTSLWILQIIVLFSHSVLYLIGMFCSY